MIEQSEKVTFGASYQWSGLLKGKPQEDPEGHVLPNIHNEVIVSGKRTVRQSARF